MTSTWRALAFGLLLGSACVFPQLGVGADCEKSGDCGSELVCQPLDPENIDGGRACLPMPNVSAPVSCANDDECVAEGYPVDAKCRDGTCVCDVTDFASVCKDTVDPTILEEPTCLCVKTEDLGCVDDSDCGGGFCVNGACSDGDAGDTCFEDADCTSLRCGVDECIEGVFGDPCDDSTDCQSGFCDGLSCG